MKKRLLVVPLWLVLSVALAHEFWLQPNQFFARVGETIRVQVLVGEHFAGERSEGRKNRILQYAHYAAGTRTDLAPTLTGDTYGDVAVLLRTAGTHLFGFANTPKFLSMRADSFLLYLREDGLDNVVAARQQRHETDKPSRELYQRCAKALVQVGGRPDATFARPLGMPLEIIPLANPYAQRAGQSAGFRVEFRGQPVSSALVRYWNRHGTNQLTEEQQRTDARGCVRFRLRAGRNMVSVVWMVPCADTIQADWHSYWGSLTFGSR